ncbi:MAG: hypothetical protein MUC43_01480 [Pirellula sp.]|jgi:hypothetical protein|nr:hypothetical protein [Pirellula sp.]
MTNRSKPPKPSLNRGLSLKTIAFLVGGLAVYALVQPIVNRNFGWNLPGPWQIVERLQSPETTRTREVQKEIAKAGEKAPSNYNSSPDKSLASPHKNQESADRSSARSPGTDAERSATNVETFLKKLPKNRFQSPAGLVYGPGSDEGHRLKHIERHLVDIPNRPGSHGVFEGSMVDFLKAIDQAYLKATKREKGTSMKEDDGATVFEATFTSPIGYLGGEAGTRQRNPKLKRMRLVVRDGNSVITAFPIR